MRKLLLFIFILSSIYTLNSFAQTHLSGGQAYGWMDITTNLPDFPARSGADRFAILKIYDVLGNEVATLVSEESTIGGAGEYEVEFNGKILTSGVYFFQLKSGSFIQTKKMVLLK